jgi:hypothetical protein
LRTYKPYCEWIKKITHDVIVYDKSDSPIENSIPRPNIGREGETFLYHIIKNYYNLYDLTIFIQADPRSNPVTYTYDEVITEINKNHEEKLKTILTWEGICNMKEYWLKSCLVLNNILFDTDEIVKYSSGVQYVIPKNVILNRPLELYEILHNQILKYGDRPLNHENKNIDNGVDAWTLELIWGKIFDINCKLKDNYKDGFK